MAFAYRIPPLARFTLQLCFLLSGLLLLAPQTAQAVPSFARQTGMQCAGCHTAFPQLNSFGRQFKLRGYTLGNANAEAPFPANLPVSALLLVTRTSTESTSGVDAEMLPRDRQAIAQTAGVYYAGRINERTGAMVQYSYDGIERRWGVEMADLRFADSTEVAGGRELLFGVTLNNAPTLTDVWNSTPMWSFPHVDSAGVMPIASTMLDMQLNSQVGGITGYALFDNLVYAEAGIYRSAKSGVMRPLGLGVEKTHVVDGYAPYWRLALQREFGAHSVSAGVLGLNARVLMDPNDPAMASDRFRDIAIDAQYQYVDGEHAFSSQVLYMQERQRLVASVAQGMATNEGNTLKTYRITAHYLYRHMLGGGLQIFSTRGSMDPMRYGMGPGMGSINGRPDTTGWIAEFDYFPVENVKLALRHTAYRKFNGGTVDYDGFGRNAKDNGNWFLMGWLMF